MEKEVTLKIPRSWIEGVPNEELTLKQIIRLGIYQYKVERAIQLYRDGVGSLGYVAEQMGLNKQDLIRESDGTIRVRTCPDLKIHGGGELGSW